MCVSLKKIKFEASFHGSNVEDCYCMGDLIGTSIIWFDLAVLCDTQMSDICDWTTTFERPSNFYISQLK